MLINSPLEQFALIPFVNLKFFFLDFSITNHTVMLGLMILFLFYIFQIITHTDGSLFAIPTTLQLLIEKLFLYVQSLVINDGGQIKKAQKQFPLVCAVFLFILIANLFGLIPYSFTITAHFFVTFGLAFYLFLGIFALTMVHHKGRYVDGLVPAGASIFLACLLVPIELISYICRPFSFSIRLFANMMAGHTLLKVIAGFAVTLMNYSGILFLCHFIPLLLLIPLVALEFAVAIIQAGVCTLLFVAYSSATSANGH